MIKIFAATFLAAIILVVGRGYSERNELRR